MYVTVNLNVVVGEPLPGATPPLVKVVRPHVAVSPRTGVTRRNEDAPNHAASANAPASLTLVPAAGEAASGFPSNPTVRTPPDGVVGPNVGRHRYFGRGPIPDAVPYTGDIR